MRTPIALPPSAKGKERAMTKHRRRFKPTIPVKDRLLSFAKNLRDEAQNMPAGRLREDTFKRARRADTAAHLDDWANSSGLQAPK
jgi:hypothetical protein